MKAYKAPDGHIIIDAGDALQQLREDIKSDVRDLLTSHQAQHTEHATLHEAHEKEHNRANTRFWAATGAISSILGGLVVWALNISLHLGIAADIGAFGSSVAALVIVSHWAATHPEKLGALLYRLMGSP